MTTPLISDNIAVQAFYEHLRGEGESHNIAEMLAFQQAPRGMTDAVFFEGYGTIDKQFAGDEKVRDQIIKRAKASGYKVNQNDVYLSALARYPGDPEAFVPATGGRGHIKEVCERRGTACEGAVTTKYREPEEAPKRTPLAKEIVDRKLAEAKRRNPDLKNKDQGELRHNIIEKHRGKD